MKRVLILYIFEKSGHHLAAMAIGEAVRERGDGCEISAVNSLVYTNPRLNQVVQRSYLSLLSNTPEVWNYLYDHPGIARKIKRAKDFINKLNSGRLEELLDSFSPQVVICTQAFPCGVVAAYKRKRNNNLSLIGVITDYAAHRYWLYDEVNFYAVPHEATKQDLIEKGIGEEKIKVTGIPVGPDFVKNQDNVKSLRELNLNSELPIVLIMGGGQGLGQVEKIVDALITLPQDFQIIVVAGLNKSLKKVLDKRTRSKKITKPVRVMGYVDDISKVMGISDIIITKPGGSTIAEALVKGLAIVISDCLPGQEEKNCRFLTAAGAAVRTIGGSEGVASVINQLLNDSQRLSSLKAEARQLARPGASSAVAEIIIKTVSGK